MITIVLLALTSAASPTCSFGEYISICNFTPTRAGAFRIISEASAAASGQGPHTLTTQYVVNGMPCTKSVTWRSGKQTVRANCVAELRAGVYYHVVATTGAQHAAHVGRVSISITPTIDMPTLRAAPVSIRVKTGS
jgi:hypothetical protein